MRIMLGFLLFVGLLAAVLFGSAGRWDLPFFWAYMGLMTANMLALCLLVDPGLQQERYSMGSGRQGLGFRFALTPFYLAHLVVAGLDAGRFHWSGAVPPAVSIIALAGFAVGMGLALWAMIVNRFFVPAVRIQAERGHHLVTAGPYRFIRHPGYLGMILLILCSGPALGSWWAMLPAAGYILVVGIRVAREDRFLRAQLTGYLEYAKSVPYRLLPGIW
jgi:protein-S-isoprenylcysteine O-methyltransferase Ste14